MDEGPQTSSTSGRPPPDRVGGADDGSGSSRLLPEAPGSPAVPAIPDPLGDAIAHAALDAIAHAISDSEPFFDIDAKPDRVTLRSAHTSTVLITVWL